MRVAGDLLSDDGLAVISYNARPGARFREAIRDMLLFATEGVEDPGERLERGRAYLSEQVEAWSEDDPEEHMMAIEARRMLRRTPEILFHDELAEVYQPQLLSDVVAAAARGGLDYLCDSLPHLSEEAFFPTPKFAAARARAGGDWARFEQFADFLTLRAFRSSIFCRGAAVDRRWAPERLRGLWALGELEVAPSLEGATFVTPDGGQLTTKSPRLTRYLGALAAAYPRALPLDEACESPTLAEMLFQLYARQVIRFRAAQVGCVDAPGEFPLAAPLARAQAAAGDPLIATLHQIAAPMEDFDLSRIVAASGWNPRPRAPRARPRDALGRRRRGGAGDGVGGADEIRAGGIADGVRPGGAEAGGAFPVGTNVASECQESPSETCN